MDSILCVRLDAMGDVLMTEPAFRALKSRDPPPRLTLLTSPAGAVAAELIPSLDEVIPYQAPWMKGQDGPDPRREFTLIERLSQRGFGAAAIFTVYSQNPLPAALLCLMAEIPLRLAHCRENPYGLLTDWVRETEPGSQVRHEVQRQIDLVESVGFRARNVCMRIRLPARALCAARSLLAEPVRPLVLIHPGGSAASRRYPAQSYAVVARSLVRDSGCTVMLTGAPHEARLLEEIRSLSDAGIRAIPTQEFATFAALIAEADVIVSNNTSAVHIASATGTPVVDLYALTNPQHTPWHTPNRVLFSDVPCKYCYSSTCTSGHHRCLRDVSPADVVAAVRGILAATGPSGASRRPEAQRALRGSPQARAPSR
ncbi:MAG: glycosyltransferase family 9 protein [Acidiferrobacteraceae bacterium]